MSSKTPRQDFSSKSSAAGKTDPTPTKPRAPPPEKTGSGGSGGGSGEGDGDACDLLIDVDLEGVRSSGLQGLLVDAELTVRLDREGAYRSVVCVRPDGVVVGALSAFRSVSTLISCLERNVEYAVRITEIGPGFCHVRGERVDR